VVVVDVASGASTRLTDRTIPAPPRPEACVLSPDGRRIAFMRHMPVPLPAGGPQPGDPAAAAHNQIFVVDVPQ
jgi:hypothetical protein